MVTIKPNELLGKQELRKLIISKEPFNYGLTSHRFKT